MGDNDFNLQETRSIGNNSLGLSSGVLLYDGGSIKNTIVQTRINFQSATLDARQFADDLALTVVQYYLAILFAQDRLDNARIQVQTTTQQLDQMDRLIAAGSKPEGDRLEILAQKAREEQNSTIIENTVSTNKLLLKQLLRLPIDQPFEIERPGTIDLEASLAEQNLLGVYNHALNNRADIQSGDLRVQSAEIGIKLAKANYYPSLSLGGNLNTLFSSLGQRIDGYTDTRIQQVIFFNGQCLKC